MDVKSVKRVSRNLFKDSNMTGKVIKPKKSKVEKYNKWLDSELDFNDDSGEWEPFWKQHKTHSK